MTDRDPTGWPWLKERLGGLRQSRPAAGGSAAGSGPPAARTAVVTDSASALPDDWVRAVSGSGQLTVVPMPVMVGAEIYGEGEDDITDTIALALAGGKPVKTSRPSPGQFEQAYLAAERLGFESIVSIHISGDLSGTVDSARLAAARVGIPVQVIDSRTVGMALGMGVQDAVRAAVVGGSAAVVSGSAEQGLARTKVYFYVPSLEQLRRGGRIGAAASVWGTMFSIKPLLSVEDGLVVPLERVRSAAKAIARLREVAVADAAGRPSGQVKLAVHHFGNPAEAGQLASELTAAIPGGPPVQITALPAVLAAHAGLGVLAVVVGESLPGQAPRVST